MLVDHSKHSLLSASCTESFYACFFVGALGTYQKLFVGCCKTATTSIADCLAKCAVQTE